MGSTETQRDKLWLRDKDRGRHGAEALGGGHRIQEMPLGYEGGARGSLDKVELAGVKSAGPRPCVSVCLSLGGPVWPLGGDGAGGPQRQPKPVISGEGHDGSPPSPKPRSRAWQPRLPTPSLIPEESRELRSGSR